MMSDEPGQIEMWKKTGGPPPNVKLWPKLRKDDKDFDALKHAVFDQKPITHSAYYFAEWPAVHKAYSDARDLGHVRQARGHCQGTAGQRREGQARWPRQQLVSFEARQAHAASSYRIRLPCGLVPRGRNAERRPAAPALAARPIPATSAGMTPRLLVALRMTLRRLLSFRREKALHAGADRAGGVRAHLLPDPADPHRHQRQFPRLAPARSQEDLDRLHQLRLRPARRRVPGRRAAEHVRLHVRERHLLADPRTCHRAAAEPQVPGPLAGADHHPAAADGGARHRRHHDPLDVQRSVRHRERHPRRCSACRRSPGSPRSGRPSWRSC